MADSPTNGNGNGNGCYLVNGAEKIPIKRSLFIALRQILVEQRQQTGSVTCHLKNGGLTIIENRFLADARE
jgi:hypothetical protein